MEKETLKFECWDPDLSGEAQDHLAAIAAEVAPRLELMKSMRQALGLTQVEVARILNTTQANVSKMERRGDPNLDVLARIADARGKRIRLELLGADRSCDWQVEI